MLPDSAQINELLARHFNDSEQCAAAAASLSQLMASTQTQAVDGAKVDLGRASRCGFPEVIFAEGKPADLIVRILQTQAEAGQPGFSTRVNPEQAATIQASIPDATYNSIARTLHLPDKASVPATNTQVAVVTAGSCDAPVAQEALETLRWMNVGAELFEDVGVAGPQRLQECVPALRNMKAIVCVAGMEAALPSVLGGYVNCPIIGVPTSVGYGASFSGVTALLSMLTCCASNVVAVNIDAGFRGGYVAGMIASDSSAPDKGEDSKP